MLGRRLQIIHLQRCIQGCDRLCYAIQDYLDGLRKERDLEEERAEDPRFLDE